MKAVDHLLWLAQGGPGDGPTALMRLCLFDWAACAIAAQQEDVVACLQHDLESNGRCATFGGETYDPATAALINGTMGHALDYDDTHFDHIGHTSAVVMPAVLAVAQDHHQAMGDILEAALVGSEAAVRIGLWLGRDHYQVGFHQTATAGAFGACIALCRLLRLDRSVTKHAIGLTATMASGLKGQFGTMGKPLNAGLAARAAVEAVTWAQAGMTSDPEGLANFAATHHGVCDETAWDLSEPWRIVRISHKFHACCHGLHAMLEALRDVRVIPAEIERVTIHTHPRWLSVCNQPSPDTGLGVKFSFAHTAAMALYGMDTGNINTFSDTVAKDEALVALRKKVAVVADVTLSEMEARITVDDQCFHHDLSQPLPLNVREARLRAKAAGLLGAERAATLWAALLSDSIDALFA